MPDLADILPNVAAFDPTTGDALFAAVPGKWCVALLLDRDGHPLQLICAKNMRAMLRRRLGLDEGNTETTPQPSKRVDYRTLVGSVRWCRVDSDFEMDLVYIDAARAAFPAHWRRLIPDRTAYFVRIDLDHPHPDFTRETGIDSGGGRLFGPFTDKAKADRWIESVRDAFDLCRYRNVLTQSPAGRACAYKQMSKCPAPCDGTIPLETYRAGVRQAIEDVIAPAVLRDRLTAQMKQHAMELAFEKAGKVKTRLTVIEQLGAGPFAAVRPIESFRFVSIQPGGRKGTAKVFLITADGATPALCVRDASASFAEVQRVLQRTPVLRSIWPSEVLLGTVCHHLAGSKSSARFASADALTETAFADRLRDAMKVDAAKTADESGEAVRETRLQL